MDYFAELRQHCSSVFLRLVIVMTTVGVLQDLGLSVGIWSYAFSWSEDMYVEGGNRITYPESRSLRIFRGGENPDGESFKEVLLDGSNLIVGSKNYVYNVALTEKGLPIKKMIHWEPSNRDDCPRLSQKQPEEAECHNYMRILTPRSSNELLVCGTNAYKPWCRTYQETEDSYELKADENGIGLCPFDHLHNSSAVYAAGQLFSGTVADVSKRDALIYRKPRQRTVQHDSQWLNDPDFVSSFEYDDKIYFFFREIAIEFINCGKNVFSRVSRVCKNDLGGMNVLRNMWTSFFKARLNCSVPGEFPFYFDEIQSTSEIGKGHYRSTLVADETHDMVYAVFTTPQNSISGSAVCAFRMSDVIRTFEGHFKEQKSAHSNWLAVKESDTPSPHPARQCHNNTLAIPDSTLTFIRTHPLIDEAVPAFGGSPILVQASFDFRMTQIVVDWQYRAVDGRRYDILYIGTDHGHVIKAVNKNRSDKIETVIIEDLVVFEDRSPIINLKLYRKEHGSPSEHLIVVTETEIRTLPLHRCHIQTSCGGCVALQDPYCSWDVDKSRCINLIGPDDMDTRYFHQSIESGKHSQCATYPSTTSSTRRVASSTTPPTTTAGTTTPCEPCPTVSQRDSPPPPTSEESGLTMPHVVGNNPGDHPGYSDPQTPGDPQEPQIGGVSEGQSCSKEKFAIAIIVPTIVCGIVGFFVGFVVSRRCCLDKQQHAPPLEENHKKAENPYTQEPNKFVTSPPFPQQGGKVKIYHNATTKQCNLNKANGSIEAIVEPHKEKKVYV